MDTRQDEPAPASALAEALRHNTWATGELIRFLRDGAPDLLGASAPGTYGPIAGTVAHIVGAEQWYFRLLSGERVGRQVRKDQPPRELAELEALTTELGVRTLALVARGLDVGRRVAMPSGATSTAGVILAQLIHHANEHRSQVATILSVRGVEPPPLSGWAYGRARGISDEGE